MIIAIALVGAAAGFARGRRRLAIAARRLWRARLEARRAAHARAEFARLGPRELRDLGLDRSEFHSCELEAVGQIEVTRLRLWSPPPGDRGPDPYCY